uniref:RNase H type-1 domain-containing protein n=1 Tax=Setaria italica TaxID=4555 RepID=K3Y1F4_SETIT
MENFQRACARWRIHGLNTLTMEALACKGMQDDTDQGTKRLILEIDCLVLTGLSGNLEGQHSEVSPVLKNMNELNRRYTDFNFLFTSLL